MSDEKPDFWTSDEWSTPPHIMEEIAALYPGGFDLDACARDITAKAPNYFTLADNAMAQSWYGRVWMNPPYSDPATWLEKATAEVANGNAEIVVALLPAATDTVWWHTYIWDDKNDCPRPGVTVKLRKGRIKFLGWNGRPKGTPKSGSAYVTFRSVDRV